MYSIGQVAELVGLPVSTLRYYDKEGFFPDLQRASGIRRFGEKELETLRVVECLKKCGLEIKEIKQFMVWCAQGKETYALRRDFFLQQRQTMERELRKMERVLDMIQYKCWYYEQALTDGTEDRIQDMLPDHLPSEIQLLYDRAHQEAD